MTNCQFASHLATPRYSVVFTIHYINEEGDATEALIVIIWRESIVKISIISMLKDTENIINRRLSRTSSSSHFTAPLWEKIYWGRGRGVGVRVRVVSSQAFTSRITVKKACMSTSEDPMTCPGGGGITLTCPLTVSCISSWHCIIPRSKTSHCSSQTSYSLFTQSFFTD